MSTDLPNLRALVPLKVVIVVESPPEKEHRTVRSAIIRAFQGGHVSSETGEAYHASGEGLGVPVLDANFGASLDANQAAREVVANAKNDALHCLVIALLYEPPSSEFQNWLKELDASTIRRDGLFRPSAMLVVMWRDYPWNGQAQPLKYYELGEYPVRPAYVGAHGLALSWRMMGDSEMPLKMFISHAKLDGLPLAQAFRGQVTTLHGLEKFYDANDILPGDDWQETLRRGVERSVVVALRTNIYEDRPWCVQELDWAEDYGCPVVVVDARTQLVRAREFLPLTGAPSAQVPDGNMPRVLQAALREALRVRLFVRQVTELARINGIGEEDLLRVPRTSLATLGMCCQDRRRRGKPISWIFVPEPFREAHRQVATQLVKSYFSEAWLGTPRQFAEEHLAAARHLAPPSTRILAGITIGLSVAYGEDSAQSGFTEDEMNRCIVRLSETLLGAGANLVFGHDWRPTGVMTAIARLAVRFTAPEYDSDGSMAVNRRCRITNLVPPGAKPELDDELRRELERRGVLGIKEVDPVPGFESRSQKYHARGLRAAALTKLRLDLAYECDARICLGGKFKVFEGFYPGILEEAWATSATQKPVYLSGMLRGATLRLICAAQGGDWETLLPPNSEPEVQDAKSALAATIPGVLPDLRRAAASLGWQRLQERSGLDPKDWGALTTATDIEVFTLIVLKGLRNRKKTKSLSSLKV